MHPDHDPRDTMHPAFARVWDAVARRLFTAESTPDLFNPYKDVDALLDAPDAAEIRRANLAAYFSAYERLPEVLLLAEAPGPWGCRFSGVPITSEAQLADPGFPLSGSLSGADGVPHAEYSAAIFWRLLQPHFPRFFVWNSVPMHPHRPDDPLSIRTPRAGETRRFEPLTREIVAALEPRLTLAVGRKAESVLARIGVAHSYVRHPSQGGASAFSEGVRAALARIDATG